MTEEVVGLVVEFCTKSDVRSAIVDRREGFRSDRWVRVLPDGASWVEWAEWERGDPTSKHKVRACAGAALRAWFSWAND